MPMLDWNSYRKQLVAGVGEIAKISPSHGEWLAWEEPRAVGDLVHVEKFFARNLGSLIRVRTGKPGRFMKATAER